MNYGQFPAFVIAKNMQQQFEPVWVFLKLGHVCRCLINCIWNCCLKTRENSCLYIHFYIALKQRINNQNSLHTVAARLLLLWVFSTGFLLWEHWESRTSESASSMSAQFARQWWREKTKTYYSYKIFYQKCCFKSFYYMATLNRLALFAHLHTLLHASLHIKTKRLFTFVLAHLLKIILYIYCLPAGCVYPLT